MDRLIGNKTYYFESLDSTNEYLLKMAGTLSEGSCVFCDMQTKGRGRKGRDWISLKAKGLYFSFLIKPKLPVEQIPKITIAVAIGIAKALDSLGVKAMIKWPNDIYLKGKKIAGILSELKLEDDFNVVVGVGLNLKHKESDFPEDLLSKASSLLIETGRDFDKNYVLDVLLDYIDLEYKSFLQKGIDLDYYKTRDFLRGKEAIYKGKVVTVRGINEDSSLLVEGSQGLIKVTGGEIDFKI